MSDAKPVTIKATVMWCNHNKINEMSEKYQLELTNLSDNTQAPSVSNTPPINPGQFIRSNPTLLSLWK